MEKFIHHLERILYEYDDAPRPLVVSLPTAFGG